MKTLKRVSRQPLYQQVRQILLKTIQDGVWKPGEKIPTEPELAEQTGVSIGTLRRAVETLVNDGILLKREGSGTYVRTYRDLGYWNVFQIYRNLEGQRRGDFARLVVFEVIDAVDEKIAKTLSLAQGKKLIHIIRHWITTKNGIEEIVSIDESFLVKDKFAGLTRDVFLTKFRSGESLYEFFDREFNVVILSQKCSAYYERLDKQTAEKLQASENFEVLCTERVSLSFGREAVEYRINRGRVDVTKIFFDLS